LKHNGEKEWKGQTKEIRVTGHRKSEKKEKDKTKWECCGRADSFFHCL
jgi:hypothetical protein